MTPAEALAAVPLFRRLRPEYLVRLEEIAARVSVESGEVLLRQGQIGQALYVVLTGGAEGRAEPSDSSTLPAVVEYSRGDYIGETAILDPSPSPHTVTATRPSRMLVLTQTQLAEEMRRDPELAIAIARDASRLPRGGPPPEIEELRQLRQQMLLYAGDLKKVYDEERARAGQLREALMDTVRVLINAIESKDPSKVGHGSRVARYAQILAREIGWDDERSVQAAIGGLIHDIGQVGLRDTLVRKKGPLSREEIGEMRQHPEMGARLLRGIRSLEPLLPYVLHHHENFDGTGYPERLRGQDIPLEARLIAVADAFDELRALTAANDPLATDAAIRDLRRLAGDRLDPDLLASFVAAYRAGRVSA